MVAGQRKSLASHVSRETRPSTSRQRPSTARRRPRDPDEIGTEVSRIIESEAARLGLHHAVVVIPDGWGTRLIARMWAEGVPVTRSTRLYAAIDACGLEQALDHAALDGRGGAALVATLDSLAALGRPGVRSGATLDPNLRLPAAGALAPACRAELARDSAGMLAFAPFLYLNRPTLDGDVVWARDLGTWNAALFARYPDRSLYRYSARQPGETPAFTPLGRDGEPSAVR